MTRIAKDALFMRRLELARVGGGGEIRTRGTLRHSCFQDRCTKPLCDSSNILLCYQKNPDSTNILLARALNN
ncbi:MAG: hypothetical protein JWP09_795 [Candidatus Taylorbacteria bacterium]|nr:hypothetical protein [Candidatus Taylorbacteria bacterium]